jgi:hypothetical protein
VEANCHFVEFPVPKASVLRVACEPDPQRNPPSQPMLAPPAENAEQQDAICRRGALPAAKSAGGELQDIAKQVLLYCFRFRKCGTFMPLSGVRGESRIAVVWTLVRNRFSAMSSGHFSILFTQLVLSRRLIAGSAPKFVRPCSLRRPSMR